MADRLLLESAAHALDSFARSVVDGLGSADTGGAYTITGTAANFDVTGAVGTATLAIGAGVTGHLAGVSALVSDQTIEVSVAALVSSGPQQAQLHSRIVSESSAEYYRLVVYIGGGGGVTALIQKRVAGSEVVLTGGGSSTDWGLGTIAANERIKMRFQTFGASPTTVRAKVWRASASEPDWLISATDSEASLQSANPVGFRFFSDAAAAAGSTFTFDNYASTAIGTDAYLLEDGSGVYLLELTEKTGSLGAITGGGTTPWAGQKAAQNTLVLTGGGTITRAGQKNGLSASSLTGGGTVTLSGAKIARLALVLTGGGTVSSAATTAKSLAFALTGGGTTPWAHSGEHMSAYVATGGGVVSSSASKAGSVTYSLMGGGTVIFTNVHGVSSSYVTTGGGSVVSLGQKGAQAAFVLSGGGTVVFEFESESGLSLSGTWTASGGGSVVLSRQKGALSSSTLSGGGAVNLLGEHAGNIFLEITGGGIVEINGYVEEFSEMIERYFTVDPPTRLELERAAQGSGINAVYSRPGYSKSLLVSSEGNVTVVRILKPHLRIQK